MFNSDFVLTETQRWLARLINRGVIEAVNIADNRATVRLGENTSAALPWLTARAGDDVTWWAPSVGEHVLVLAPGGDMTAGVILAGLYSTDKPAPQADANIVSLATADGASVTYDKSAKKLTAVLPDGGSADVTAPAGLKITGPVDIDGPLRVRKDVTADQAVTAAGNVSSGADVRDRAGTMAEMRTAYNAHTHGATPSPTPKM